MDDEQQKQARPPVYKKWFRTRDRAGFLSVDPWLDAGKCAIDIGEVDPKTNSVKGHTQAWTDIVDLATFLQTVRDGRGSALYPKEEFMSYGGTRIDGVPVSRVLRIHPWESGGTVDATGFAWKTGHFDAKESGQGAFIPNMDKMRSSNLIKVTRVEMAEISYRLNLHLTGYVARTPEYLERWSTRS